MLKRGLEVLTGPVLHLQGLKRAQAANLEEQLAEALRAEGLLVQGGHWAGRAGPGGPRAID